MPSHVASESSPDDVRLRVVADHVRSCLMLIGDGVTPGNEGRGYVLRRMLRRAVRSMRLLGWSESSRACPQLLPVSMERMSATYPELRRDFERISRVAYAEEEAFRRTLASGTTMLDTAVAQVKAAGGDTRQLSGAQAFALHDTYGFPIDLTLEMAAEQGVSVDEPGFRRLMAEQRDRARADAKAKKQTRAPTPRPTGGSPTAIGHDVEFTGYDEVVSEARVAGLVVDGEGVDRAGAGDDVEIILDRTPFYAEGGGQLADGGRIELDNGAVIEVRDVQKPINGVIAHRATVVVGEVMPGALAQAEVDVERRRAISRAHTATHMVHRAIREALGDSATQAGSQNSPGRFRFDFTALQAVPGSVLADVEAKVNTLLVDDLPVTAEVMTQAQAREIGAMALFGEKYGDAVRVVSVGDWARELCGGTHAQRSGQLGLVKLLGESSIGSGRAPGRGARRRRRVLLPGPRARHRRPAHRGPAGPARGAARADLRHPRPPQGGGAGDRARAPGEGARRGGRPRRRGPRPRRHHLRQPRRRRTSAPTTCAPSSSTCAAGSAPTGRRSSPWRRSPGRGRWSSSRPPRAPATPGSRRERSCGWPRRRSVAAAAARTTSRRAAAPTRARSPPRWAPWRTRCGSGRPEHRVNRRSGEPPGRRAGPERACACDRLGAWCVRVSASGSTSAVCASASPRATPPACSPPRSRPWPATPPTRTPTSSGSSTPPVSVDAVEIVVGLPRLLSGAEGEAARLARAYALDLAAAVAPVPVRLVDERLTTVDAHRRLRESGVAGRSQRDVVDQTAAVLILQSALDGERASGRAPGSRVGPQRRRPRAKDRG